MTPITRRTFLGAGGALVVGFGLGSRAVRRAAAQAASSAPAAVWPADRYLGKTVAPDQVDAFLAIHADNTVTVFTGKVDLGTGGRAAMRQMVAEELDVPIERITELIEGDTAVCPDQGGTGGSTGISRGGQELRRAGATAREALLALASQRLGRPVGDLEVADGVVRPKSGGAALSYGDLIGDRQLNVKIDAKAPLKPSSAFRYIGRSVPRPDVPAKVTGRHLYVQNLTLPGMLHGRVIRTPAVGAQLQSIEESSIAAIPGARAVRLGNFLGVVAEREWDAVRAARALRAQWSAGTGLPDHAALADAVRATRIVRDQDVAKKGDLTPLGAPGPGVQTLGATYWWPVQTHGSLGPSCGVADVRADRATVWTSSQATHRFRETFARLLGLPRDKVRLIYLDGSGSYGQAGAEDAAFDAALLSRAVARPVRVQWTREDEHVWDPKGPPQLLDLRAAVAEGGDVLAWETQAWLPVATQGLPSIPLLAPLEAGINQPLGRSSGQIQQNIDPPYRVGAVHAVVHWVEDSPFRTSPIRTPGKIANTFAVESFVDEVCAVAKLDPVAYRLGRLADSRAQEVIKRAAARMGWQPRPSPGPVDPRAAVLTGRGIAYVHYKHAENHVAIGMEVAVERATGVIRVTRVVCAQDCGLMINPDNVASQLEGNILQTLSRTLHEDIVFDRERVTSVDWASYPILRFDEVPVIELEMIQRLDDPPLGVGEAASAPVPAALGNAVFDATGIRLRVVPFRPDRVKAALAAART